MTTTYLDQPYGSASWQIADVHVADAPVATAIYLRGGGMAVAATGPDLQLGPWSPLLSSGISIVSANYAGYDGQGGVFPNPQREVAQALAWAKANASTYGLAGPLGLIGKSYGGMLAAALAFGTLIRHEPIAFFVNLLGMTDWRKLAGPPAQVPGATAAWEHVTGSAAPFALKHASGLWHLEQAQAAGNVAHVPPVYSWYGQASAGTAPTLDPHDPLFGEATKRMLDALGLESELHVGVPLDLADVAAFVLRVLQGGGQGKTKR